MAGLLTCARLRLLLANKAFGADEALIPETERWYGTRYGAGPLPQDWHEARRAAGAAEVGCADRSETIRMCLTLQEQLG